VYRLEPIVEMKMSVALLGLLWIRTDVLRIFALHQAAINVQRLGNVHGLDKYCVQVSLKLLLNVKTNNNNK